MKTVITLLLASFDIVIAMLSFIGSIWVDAALMALIGLGNGYRAILLITWMQTRTLKAMSGRIMNILMFWDLGLVPVSQTASGAISTWSP